VKLTCVVDLGSSGAQSAAVFWYLDGQALDWLGQTGRGRGVQVTEKRGNQVRKKTCYFCSVLFHLGLIVRITTQVELLKSNSLQKIECSKTHIYLKTECIDKQSESKHRLEWERKGQIYSN